MAVVSSLRESDSFDAESYCAICPDKVTLHKHEGHLLTRSHHAGLPPG